MKLSEFVKGLEKQKEVLDATIKRTRKPSHNLLNMSTKLALAIAAGNRHLRGIHDDKVVEKDPSLDLLLEDDSAVPQAEAPPTAAPRAEAQE
jgi:hypothetical protein